MRIGNFQFKPKLFTTVLTILLLPVLIGLGIWQLQRAAEKELIVMRQQSKMQMPVMKLSLPVENLAEHEFRRIAITGQFDTRYQIFIDNKVHEGRIGYQVVTPLCVDVGNTCILINRGWVPMNADRKILPDIRTPQGAVTVTGIAKLDPKDVADFGSANRSNTGWPAVVRWLDIATLQQETGLQLQSFVILQLAEQDSGFVREWRFINTPPEKSLAYAAQWFSFAAILLILYIVLNTRRIDKTGEQ